MPHLVRGFFREFASFGALLAFVAMVTMWSDLIAQAARY